MFKESYSIGWKRYIIGHASGMHYVLIAEKPFPNRLSAVGTQMFAGAAAINPTRGNR
jgi:hypothetical protein